MNPNPPFLKSFNPAGRIVFALTPNKQFLEMFEEVIDLIGQKIGNLLVSMYYLENKSGPARLLRIRNMCDRLFIDSGVFSFRSRFLKEMGISIRVAYWKLSMEEKQQLLEMGNMHKEEFDDFAQRYAEFLRVYDNLFDIAVDLDVDQFLGLSVAEEYYQLLCERTNSQKIMRVWHSFGRNWDDWVEWCKSKKYAWLALEGPDQHNRDTKLYRRLISVAHQYGVNVHVLAVTTPSFLACTPVDTCDSSTYTVGGRWARLLMPNGVDVLMGNSYKAYYKQHYDNLPRDQREYTDDVVHYLGFTVDELRESHIHRCMFNVLVLLVYYDVPASEKSVDHMLF